LETFLQWCSGLVFALGIGHIGVELFLRWLRGRKPERERVPAWLTGLVERFFFTLVVAFEVGGAATAMIAWIAAKMLANWNRAGQPATDEQIFGAFSALLAGALSMTFALFGGLIADGRIWPG
jgi:hypothetical protein